MIRAAGESGSLPEPTSCAPIDELVSALHRSALAFNWDPSRAGIDLAVDNEIDGYPNRARVKFFEPQAGTAAAWFYKDSQVHFSTDRFSYGAVVMKGRPLDEAQRAALLTWLERGLHPELRPDFVRRAFPFTIPN